MIAKQASVRHFWVFLSTNFLFRRLAKEGRKIGELERKMLENYSTPHGIRYFVYLSWVSPCWEQMLANGPGAQAMCIACNDTSVIVINFRKSKTHAITDTYCTFFQMKLLLKLLKLIHQHDILCTMPWCGCPSCLELDQAENNPRVTLLPLHVTDRDKWEKGDDIPRVQEKIKAKPQKILCFVQRQRKKRFLLPKDTRKLVVIDEEEPEAPRLSSSGSSVWGICGKLWTSRIFCGTFFSWNSCFTPFFGTSTARGRSKLEHHDVIWRFWKFEKLPGNQLPACAAALPEGAEALPARPVWIGRHSSPDFSGFFTTFGF